MNGYLRQATASQVRTIGPFLDDTDFKTLENGLTINNTDIVISINGGADGTKASGGATAHGAGGIYTLTWDATDTASVGELFYSVKVAGALVVFGTYVVLEEAVYDALFAASALGYVANAPVNVAQLSGDATAADNAEAFFDGTGYAGTNNVIPTVTTTTNLTTNNDKSGYSLTATTGLGNQTANITGNLSGSVGSIATGGIAAASFAAGAIDATAIATGSIDADAIAADAANEIADAILARNVAGGSSTGRLVKEALYVLRNKTAIAAGTLTVYGTDDATPAFTAAVTTAAGDPIDSIDPA